MTRSVKSLSYRMQCKSAQTTESGINAKLHKKMSITQRAILKKRLSDQDSLFLHYQPLYSLVADVNGALLPPIITSGHSVAEP